MEATRHILALVIVSFAVSLTVFPFLTALSPAPWQFLAAAVSLTALVMLVESGWRAAVAEAEAEVGLGPWFRTELAFVIMRWGVVSFGLLAVRRILNDRWF